MTKLELKAKNPSIADFYAKLGAVWQFFFKKKITKFFVSFQKKEKFENGLKIDQVGATKPKIQVSPISMPS